MNELIIKNLLRRYKNYAFTSDMISQITGKGMISVQRVLKHLKKATRKDCIFSFMKKVHTSKKPIPFYTAGNPDSIINYIYQKNQLLIGY